MHTPDKVTNTGAYMHAQIIDLAGNWQLTTKSKRVAPCKASLPGDIVSALLANDSIPDPYIGENEKHLQWIGQEDWEFHRSFTLDENQRNNTHWVLRIDQLDTIAEISVNGSLVHTSDNAFRGYCIELDHVLVTGTNDITIRICSPEKEAARRAETLPYEIPHMIAPVQSPHRNLIRKTQCHGGWDWGPCIMTGGVYGSIVLHGSPCERIDALYSRITQKTKENWTLEIFVDINSYQASTQEISYSVRDGEATIVSCKKTEPLKQGRNTCICTLEIDNPKLWWTHDRGEQALYSLLVDTQNDHAHKNIAFRSISIDTREDEHGKRFALILNGEDIVCKGANWIPPDALPARHSDETYEYLIRSAQSAHMNMLRVWGGGHYERDVFYERCDQEGILVWQDCMFACSLYPADETFLENVSEEISYQIKRLMTHPCIALWCGNNEDLGALRWFEASQKNRDIYVIDYDRLTEGTIGRVIQRLDPTRLWWPSSPSAGPGDYSDCWHDDSRGDMHYWSVWHEGKPFEEYETIIPRFCSEFGFQSFPSLPSVRDFCDDASLNISSPQMEHHQKNDRGNTIIIETMTRYFRMPSSFPHTLYLSQVQQAMAIEKAVDYWSCFPERCRGFLYWQLNDCWPVSSWSSVEYSGRWKLLHYCARRFFAPLRIIWKKTDRTVELIGINESAKPCKARIALDMFDFHGTSTPLDQDKELSLPPRSHTVLASFPFDSVQQNASNAVVRARLHDQSSDALLFEKTLFMDLPKRCKLEQARIRADLDGNKLILSTDKPAFYVRVEHPDPRVQFSDNCFHLYPDAKRVLSLEPLASNKTYSLQDFDICHLRASYS